MAYDAPAADRRQFLTWTAGGAFLLAVAGPSVAQQGRGGAPGGAAPANNSPWFTVESNGRVTVWSSSVEMGQGTHTGHAAIIADELDVPWSMVDVKMVDLSKYGNSISTGGSTGLRTAYPLARQAGATARMQFRQAAAARWNVPVDQVQTAGGKVVNTTTKAELTYAELASAAGALPPPANVTPKDPAQRNIIGKDQETKRLRERVSGREIYGIDTRVDGMMRATIIQAPQYGAKLASVDEAPAMAIRGVKKVVKLDNAVAVIASDTWTAFKARDALKPVWTGGQTTSTAGLSAQLAQTHAAALAAAPSAQAAPLRAAFSSASKKVEASYELAHLNHVTMEPQNAIAHVTANKIEIWAPTQIPTATKRAAVGWAGKPAGTEVVLHTTMLGGGFGRRLSNDFIEQAVRIAAQTDTPEHLVWTREEDFAHDMFRRAVRQTYRTGLNADGMIEGYEAISAASDAPVTDGWQHAPYGAIKASAITQAGTREALAVGIPQGFWRSVDPGISTWGRESFIDECAHAAGKDPVDYRLAHLGTGDTADRVKRLINTVAEKIDWKKRRPAGKGVGIAVGTGFGSYYAHAIEVEVKNKAIKVTRMVVAADLGTVVAPNQVKAQFQGGGLMALGAALAEAQTFTNGKSDNNQFGQYNVLRHHQAPIVEVYLFDSPNASVGGSGEPPMPTVAPALANAVFAATGQRVRSLPFAKQGYAV